MPNSTQPATVSANSRTTPRTFRILLTHDSLLDRARNSGRASAIVRVLLSLYFNRKIEGVEPLIDAEVAAAKQAEAARLERHRESMKAAKQRG